MHANIHIYRQAGEEPPSPSLLHYAHAEAIMCQLTPSSQVYYYIVKIIYSLLLSLSLSNYLIYFLPLSASGSSFNSSLPHLPPHVASIIHKLQDNTHHKKHIKHPHPHTLISILLEYFWAISEIFLNTMNTTSEHYIPMQHSNNYN